MRETFAYDVAEMPPCDADGNPTCREVFMYRATSDIEDMPWVPSIHMPRRASGITLEITETRAERLQEISGKDCEAKGIEFGWADARINHSAPRAREDVMRFRFRQLWESINGDGSWDANPFVWVVAFNTVTP